MSLPADLRELVPAAACDCHVHIVGRRDGFPQTANRTYAAGVASLGALRALAEPCGITRFVLVQPSFYGDHNTCLLDSLAALQASRDCGRGVVVLSLRAATDALLREYAHRGVCGIRCNLYSPAPGLAAADLGAMLRSWAGRLPGGWHVEIIAPVTVLLASAQAIADFAAPVVVNHYGLPGSAAPATADGTALLKILALPHVWTKLSAPYRVLADALGTTPPADWLPAILQVAAERCVWGSDWPYTPEHAQQKGPNIPAPYRSLEYERVLGDFMAAVRCIAGDPLHGGLMRRILLENPARLYGFTHH